MAFVIVGMFVCLSKHASITLKLHTDKVATRKLFTVTLAIKHLKRTLPDINAGIQSLVLLSRWYKLTTGNYPTYTDHRISTHIGAKRRVKSTA